MVTLFIRSSRDIYRLARTDQTYHPPFFGRRNTLINGNPSVLGVAIFGPAFPIPQANNTSIWQPEVWFLDVVFCSLHPSVRQNIAKDQISAEGLSTGIWRRSMRSKRGLQAHPLQRSHQGSARTIDMRGHACRRLLRSSIADGVENGAVLMPDKRPAIRIQHNGHHDLANVKPMNLKRWLQDMVARNSTQKGMKFDVLGDGFLELSIRDKVLAFGQDRFAF